MPPPHPDPSSPTHQAPPTIANPPHPHRPDPLGKGLQRKLRVFFNQRIHQHFLQGPPWHPAPDRAPEFLPTPQSDLLTAHLGQALLQSRSSPECRLFPRHSPFPPSAPPNPANPSPRPSNGTLSPASICPHRPAPPFPETRSRPCPLHPLPQIPAVCRLGPKPPASMSYSKRPPQPAPPPAV